MTFTFTFSPLFNTSTLLLLSFLLVREKVDWVCGNGLAGWLELRQVAGREDGHSATRSTGS